MPKSVVKCLAEFFRRAYPERRQRIGLVLLTAGVGLLLLSFTLLAFYGREEAKEITPKADVNAWCPSSSSNYVLLIEQGQRVIIPRIGVNELIREGVDEATLNKGVGHFPETARPGEDGNCALTAHAGTSSIHGAPFGRLEELEKGDEIVLYDKAGKMYKYVVTEHKIIASTDFSVLDPTGEPSVTLVTCVVPSRVTHQRRVIVGVLKR